MVPYQPNGMPLNEDPCILPTLVEGFIDQWRCSRDNLLWRGTTVGLRNLLAHRFIPNPSWCILRETTSPNMKRDVFEFRDEVKLLAWHPFVSCRDDLLLEKRSATWLHNHLAGSSTTRFCASRQQERASPTWSDVLGVKLDSWDTVEWSDLLECSYLFD